MEVGATEVVESEVFYDCVICGQSGPSTEDRPIGLVVLLQASSGNSLRLLQFPQPNTPFIDLFECWLFDTCKYSPAWFILSPSCDWQCWDTAAKVKKPRSSPRVMKNISTLLTRVGSRMTSGSPSCRGSSKMYVLRSKLHRCQPNWHNPFFMQVHACQWLHFHDPSNWSNSK